jgi:hypothetical protein
LVGEKLVKQGICTDLLRPLRCKAIAVCRQEFDASHQNASNIDVFAVSESLAQQSKEPHEDFCWEIK